MRHLTRPTQQGPGGPGWTYAQRSPPDITSSSTASTNVASWTTRLAADGKLLGSQRPNTIMRVPKSNPEHLLSTTGGPTSYVEGFNTTSTAANDRGSWHYRQAVVAEKTQRLGATWSSGQHAAASGQGGSGAGTGRLGGTGRTGAVYGSNYVRTSRPDITQWSTASVNKVRGGRFCLTRRGGSAAQHSLAHLGAVMLNHLFKPKRRGLLRESQGKPNRCNIVFHRGDVGHTLT